MTTHELAKMLLEKPNTVAVVQSLRTTNDKYWMGGTSALREVSSIVWTNHKHFIDKNGDEGNDYNSGRECVEIK